MRRGARCRLQKARLLDLEDEVVAGTDAVKDILARLSIDGRAYRRSDERIRTLDEPAGSSHVAVKLNGEAIEPGLARRVDPVGSRVHKNAAADAD